MTLLIVVFGRLLSLFASMLREILVDFLSILVLVLLYEIFEK
jgi:hypothetical protein